MHSALRKEDHFTAKSKAQGRFAEKLRISISPHFLLFRLGCWATPSLPRDLVILACENESGTVSPFGGLRWQYCCPFGCFSIFLPDPGLAAHSPQALTAPSEGAK